MFNLSKTTIRTELKSLSPIRNRILKISYETKSVPPSFIVTVNIIMINNDKLLSILDTPLQMEPVSQKKVNTQINITPEKTLDKKSKLKNLSM